MLQWTYGVSLMKGGKEKLSIQRVLKAPFMVGIIIGLIFFFTGLPMPELIGKAIGHLAGINTPLAMFSITFMNRLFVLTVSLVRAA